MLADEEAVKLKGKSSSLEDWSRQLTFSAAAKEKESHVDEDADHDNQANSVDRGIEDNDTEAKGVIADDDAQVKRVDDGAGDCAELAKGKSS